MIFLDFDGTLSDMPTLWEQYTQKVGELLAAQFGGDALEWASATLNAHQTVNREYVARFSSQPTPGYKQWLQQARLQSTELIFTARNLPVPTDTLAFVMETQYNALIQCNALYEGAAECLESLIQAGRTLHIASANDSEFLTAALIGGGIDSFITHRFGPDLLDCAKEGVEFYECLFAETGIEASQAIVVDDHPETLQWAIKSGANVIQVRLSPTIQYPDVEGVIAILTDLRDLPPLIEQILPKAAQPSWKDSQSGR